MITPTKVGMLHLMVAALGASKQLVLDVPF